MPVGWERERPTASPEDVTALEGAIGATLPEPYRRFLAKGDGGEPEANIIDVPGADDQSVGVTEFFGAAGVREELERLGERIPSGTVPVADAEGGNLVLIALDSGAVLFWDHELEADLDEAVSEIAPDFDAFLEGLEPFDASHVQLKPGQVKSVWTHPDFVEPED